ncbi:MAG: 16S rRNA (cytidine(1402)-2'-O)-methyltransferase [Bacteroidetes bacterium]|nr:16S rRNA (cytidine(1402)-2'-O)-methyltransferase [Bacteroidota bacterium]
MGKLILVPTPIGNLEDLTFRALRLLQLCDCIFAEDTRVTKKLLDHYEIQKKIFSFHTHNEHRTLLKSIELIAQNNVTVLVSDAGTPGISDPGFLLVRECLKQGIDIECLPGPTALIPALVGSGFPCDRFVFEGFLPHKKGRMAILKRLSEEERTIVMYESPHRLKKCLEQMKSVFELHREVCVVREISKKFETFHRGNLGELSAFFEENQVRGEIVIVIKGKE